MDRADELIATAIDGRLDERERNELDALLAANGQRLDLLISLHAEDRALRLAIGRSDEGFVATTMAGVRAASRAPRRIHFQRWAYATATACAAMLMFGVLWLRASHAVVDEPIVVVVAHLDASAGTVRIERRGVVVARAQDLALVADDLITVDPGAAASLRLADGGTLSLAGDTRLRLTGMRRASLLAGEIDVDLSPRPGGARFVVATALAEAAMMDSRFTLAHDASDRPGTRLAVAVGSVRLVRLVDSMAIDVDATQSAVIAPGEPFGVREAGESRPRVGAGFSLIDADRDVPIPGYDPLLQGAVLDLDALPTRHLNLRANVAAGVVAVEFTYDGQLSHRGRYAPFSLGSDEAGDYAAWTPTPGRHEVVATPIAADGVRGVPLRVSFTVVDRF